MIKKSKFLKFNNKKGLVYYNYEEAEIMHNLN